MRIWGRVFSGVDEWTWVPVTEDANGFRDAIYLTNLIQVLLLGIDESPFYSQYGIPAQMDVVQQVLPDFYVSRIQQLFSGFFASLIISRVPDSSPPTYNLKVVTNLGSIVSLNIPGNDRYQLSPPRQ